MDGFAVMDISRYENLYEEEGYRLSATASVYVPWFRCTLKCRCEKEKPMSELDQIICKCILRGISSADDISFVLSLDSEITKGKLEELLSAGILADENGTLKITQSGSEFYCKKSRVNAEINEYKAELNAITGTWSITEQKLKESTEVADSAICLSPAKTVIKLDIENNDEIRRGLQKKYETCISSVRLLDYKILEYQEETILFYENGDGKLLFALYNGESDQLDTVLADALFKRYKRQEILELMQAEKYLGATRNRFIQKSVEAFQSKNSQQHSRYLWNREIRELFMNVFDDAEKEIFIISPWINDWVVNDVLIKKIENALSRGVLVTIGYGYIPADKMEQKCKDMQVRRNDRYLERDKDWKSWNMAKMLKDKFLHFDAFTIFQVKEGTHEKILSYDEKYTLVGSYNLLSYDGGEEKNYRGPGFRFEGAVLVEDAILAKDVKSHFRNCM